MTQKETIKLIGIITMAYPNFDKFKDENHIRSMIAVWADIFRDNAPTVPAQPRLHIDRKRMRELQELRIALGHQPDDHEEKQTQTQTWGGMTMKGW